MRCYGKANRSSLKQNVPRDFGHHFVLGDKDSQVMVVFNPSTQETDR